MGGTGPGHKSERARRARLINMAKARAARKREPLRWRSGLESRIIEQLVWQWWQENSRRRLVVSDWKNQLEIPRRSVPRNNNETKSWSRQRVARFLGVSHTWINKLVKKFEVDPDRERRRMAAFAPATFEKLERARKETERQRQFGWLRGPIRMRRVKWTIGGKTQRAIAWTHAERQRRAGQVKGGFSVPDGELPSWARG
jgi:hypothetical protein